MTTLELLRKKLQIHNRDCQSVPADNEEEVERRMYIGMLLQLQIECEEWRRQVQVSFYLCSTKTITEETDNLIIEKIRTVFKWEELRDNQLNAILEKELKGIAYLQELIKRTYMTSKQKFENGLRFSLPGSDTMYKLVQDHYGKDYIAYLNCGKWDFAMTIIKVTEQGLICPNGEHESEVLFNDFCFVNQ